MTALLALDIGNRRTGVAFADESSGYIIALDTVRHHTEQELIDAVIPIVQHRTIAELIIGLPRLPQGEEGSQAMVARNIGEALSQSLSIPVMYVDERFTSMNRVKGTDPDAQAACTLLSIVLDQRKKRE